MVKKEYLQPAVTIVNVVINAAILTGSLTGVGGQNLNNPSDLSGNDYNTYF